MNLWPIKIRMIIIGIYKLTNTVERRYLGPEHKEYSEKCQREVAKMQRYPLTYEQFLNQIEHNRKGSELEGLILK